MSGNRKRNRFLLRFEGVYRRFFLVFLADKEKSFLLTEFPKSGGSWLTKMLSELIGIDFPQNSFPVSRCSAFQGHYLKAFCQRKIVVLWRDPRDIMVSWYFHSVVGNDHSNESFVASVRRQCGIKNPDDVILNLPKFIDFAFSGKMSPGFTWNDFYDRWHDDPSAIHVSYEELRSDPVSALERVAVGFGFQASFSDIESVVDKYSFQNISGRKEGQEDSKSFVRKGIVGDWRNYFSEEASLIFNDIVGHRNLSNGKKNAE